MMDITKLVKVSNYAKQNNISHTYVYTLGKQGKIHLVVIDGVNFIYCE
jgi:hypothetical protein